MAAETLPYASNPCRGSTHQVPPPPSVAPRVICSRKERDQSRRRGPRTVIVILHNVARPPAPLAGTGSGFTLRQRQSDTLPLHHDRHSHWWGYRYLVDCRICSRSNQRANRCRRSKIWRDLTRNVIALNDLHPELIDDAYQVVTQLTVPVSLSPSSSLTQ